MSTAQVFQLKIVGDVADAKRSLGQIESRMGKFTGLMKKLAGGMVAVFAVKKAYEFGKAMVDRAEEMQSAYAITENVINRTNGAANITAEELKKVNKQLSLRTGIDKRIVTEGSNVLLTFKSIRNEVGEGNDVFNRANELVHDMSAVFKTSATSAATQLGKALEDPIKGVGALARVGVTFTAEQKRMIAAMVESGDVLGAQQIVLEALEGQVGGSAEASADATAKITNAWKEVQEWLGNIILPLLEKLADWIWETAIPAFEAFGEWVTDTWNTITGIFQSGSNEQLETAKGWLSEIIGYYKDFAAMVEAIINRFVVVATWIWENYGEQITAVFQAVWREVSAAIDLVIGVLRNLIRFITAVFNGDWAGAWEAARAIIDTFWDYFKGLPGRIVGILREAVGLAGRAALDLGKAIVNGIISFWNKLDPRITIGPMPRWLPGIGGKKWQSPDLLPDIPQLAKGGIVTGPTVAMIGEAGPEAVIPLNRRGSMGNTYHITVEAHPGADMADAGRKIVEAIVAHERYAGEGWRTRAVHR